LHVINSLILAGVEMLLAEMLPHFQERGLENSVAVLKTLDSPLEKRLRESGVPFLPIESTIHSLSHPFALARYLPDYDVVQSYLYPAQLWVAMAAALGKPVPLVTTEQSTDNRRRVWWFHPLDRWMYTRYRAIACNSEATQASLLAWQPTLRDRVSVVPNGVPLERFENATATARRDFLPHGDGPIVMFVARLQREKDHTTLVRAMAKVPNAQLVLVGDGELRPEIVALAAHLGLAGRVTLLGRRPDVAGLLKSADVYVHSSHFEGFGIAAVEAMAAGVPVIATDVPGLAEVVRGAGLLFPAGDADTLAARINEVLGSPPLREQLVRSGHERARSFSIERSADEYVAIYRRVLEESSKRG